MIEIKRVGHERRRRRTRRSLPRHSHRRTTATTGRPARPAPDSSNPSTPPNSPNPLRCIYRIDRPSGTYGSIQHGWYLNKNFGGRRYRVYFADSRYGGREKARKAAMLERDWLDQHRLEIMNELEMVEVVKGPEKVEVKEIAKKVMKETAAQKVRVGSRERRR